MGDYGFLKCSPHPFSAFRTTLATELPYKVPFLCWMPARTFGRRNTDFLTGSPIFQVAWRFLLFSNHKVFWPYAVLGSMVS